VPALSPLWQETVRDSFRLRRWWASDLQMGSPTRRQVPIEQQEKPSSGLRCTLKLRRSLWGRQSCSALARCYAALARCCVYPCWRVEQPQVIAEYMSVLKSTSPSFASAPSHSLAGSFRWQSGDQIKWYSVMFGMIDFHNLFFSFHHNVAITRFLAAIKEFYLIDELNL
jgi:hypothetical protein